MIEPCSQVVIVEHVEHAGNPGEDGEGEHVSVGRREEPVGQRSDGVRWLAAGDETAPQVPEEIGDPTVDAARLRLEHREIDVGAGSRPLSHLDRSHGGGGGEVAALIGGDVAAELDRFPPVDPRSVHRATHGVGDDVGPDVVGIGTGLTERGDARDDETRVVLGQGAVPEPSLVEVAGRERLDHHVGSGGERGHEALVGWIVEVDDDRPLVGVEVEEERALLQVDELGYAIATTAVIAMVRIEGERTVVPGRVATRWLRLDHLRPEVGQELPSERAGYVGCQLQHPDAGKRLSHVGDVTHGSIDGANDTSSFHGPGRIDDSAHHPCAELGGGARWRRCR